MFAKIMYPIMIKLSLISVGDKVPGLEAELNRRVYGLFGK